MIGKKSLSVMNKAMTGAKMMQVPARGFAGGGPKKASIDPKETNFDIVFVGK